MPLALPKTPQPGKGLWRCNISACQCLLDLGNRWWNKETRAYYCQPHAWRINENPLPDGSVLCARECNCSECRWSALQALGKTAGADVLEFISRGLPTDPGACILKV